MEPRLLAVEGGVPVRTATSWPDWPQVAPGAHRAIGDVLHSGRWAITSPRRGDLFERRFAELFARYTGSRYCVPTDHGSSALIIALESLGLEHGSPVLVPALTWTASASAVFRAGLVPVLTDVDPGSGCVSAQTVRAAPSAAAIVVVHWACAMADVPAIAQVARAQGADVVEDAAQAHGATWQGRAAGSLGRLGCFSMQHSKVLTCGEGGAVVTDDSTLEPRLQELRADSRRYRDDPRQGELDLVESASVMGANFCLNEFSAALLCEQLTLLDQQHQVRNRNYRRLAALIADVPGVRLLSHSPQQDKLSLYEVPIVFEDLPAGTGNAWVAAALSAELGTRVYTPRVPLHRSALLRPWTKPTLAPLTERFLTLHRDRAFPGAEYLAAHAVLLHHSAFLGPEEDMRCLAEAVARVALALRRRPPTPVSR